MTKSVDELLQELTEPKAVNLFWSVPSARARRWMEMLAEINSVLAALPRARAGRPSDPARHALDATVGTVLRRAGVRLAKSRDGAYAAILSLIHEAVGLPPALENFAALRRAVQAAQHDPEYSWCQYEYETRDEQLWFAIGVRVLEERTAGKPRPKVSGAQTPWPYFKV